MKESCCFCDKEINNEKDCGKYTILPGIPNNLFLCTEYNVCEECIQKFFKWVKENPLCTIDMIEDFFDELSKGNGDN